MTPAPHQFQSADLVAGHVVLDLLNTVTARDTTPHDWLATPASLLQWAGISGHFDSGHLARLQRLAGAQPAAARAALRRCRRLREALHSVFSALQQGRAVDAQALQTLERQRRTTLARCTLAATAQGVVARPTVEQSGLDFVVDVLLVDALPLLAAPPLDRLRTCDGTGCGWMFIDSSKAGRRRWCDMATCGTSHKLARLQQRKAAARPARKATAKGSA